MATVKKSIALILSLILLSCMIGVIANAGDQYQCQTKSNWNEITRSEADEKYNNGEKFIIVFYAVNNSNCGKLDDIFCTWMDDCSEEIYGVNITDKDTEGYSSWAVEGLGVAITPPLVVFVDNKEVKQFTGAEDETIDDIKEAFEEFTGKTPSYDPATPADPVTPSDTPSQSSDKTEYTLTYDANGGTGAPAPQKRVGKGTVNISSDKPKLDGYIFRGWARSEGAVGIPGEAINIGEGAAVYLPGASYTLDRDSTLYALWDKIGPDDFMLSYNANGGILPPDDLSSHGYIKLSTKEPVYDEHTFRGWTDPSDSTSHIYKSGEVFNLTKDTVLYAVWDNHNPTSGLWIDTETYREVDYLSSVTVTARACPSLPAGYAIIITDTDNGDRILASSTTPEVSIHLPEVKEDRHFAVSIVRDGEGIYEPKRDTEGNQLIKPVTVDVKNCLLDRILGYFRKILGLLPDVYMGPK